MATLAMVLSVAMGTSQPVVAQQSGDTYQFGSGQTLAWSGGWELDPESTVEESGLELVMLQRQLSFVAVMSVPAGIDMDFIRDEFLTGFLGSGESSITIDRGSYGAVSYSLDTIAYEGIDMGAFTLLRAGEGSAPTFTWIFLSLIPSFASEFTSAQSAFTLDGAAPFTGIEPQGLQDQLQNAVATGNVPDGPAETPEVAETEEASTPGGDQTPEVTETEEATTPEGEETPSSGGSGGLKGGNDQQPTEATDPTEEVADPTEEAVEPTEDVGVPPAGDVGLIDDWTYVSRASSVEVTWGPNLELNPDRDPNPSVSESGIERVALVFQAPAAGFVSVSITPLGDATIANYVAVWSSDDFIADVAFSTDSEILLSETSAEAGGVARIDYLDDGTPILFYTEFQLDAAGESVIITELSTAGHLFADAYDIGSVEVELDGNPAIGYFTGPEIMEAAGL